ncbi:universal stress protein [Parapedobacter deserti]|uniref:Universal stress protein n=1 Tax=Parapedobacter deserti TaxID=1912957 RepID=A0ABV7JL09_9SPHI
MQTIIITTDFSESSRNAAKYAAALVKPLGISHIILYHSNYNIPVSTEIPVVNQDTDLAYKGSLHELEMAERELHLVLGEQADVGIELVTNDLPLLTGVNMLAEQRRADLVVVGTTGKSNFERVLVGTNTVNLAAECMVPLLVVPRNARFEPIKKIVFACDLKRASHNTPVGQIDLWLQRLQAELLVLNVTTEGKHLKSDIIAEQHELYGLLDGLRPAYHYAESDDVAEEIENFAEGQHAGLIITIPKSYGFFERLFHRSVSKQLIKASSVPLLLLKEME